MSDRPKILHVGGTLYWVIRTRNPDTEVLKDADSTPTVAVRKNGASVGDSVTITKRSATTGIYDCSYNPAGEVEGDEFTIEESATVTGTTTSSATYANSWEFTVIAVERGTDGANTTTPPTAAANATAVRSELATELARIDVATSTRLASASYSAPPSAGTIADAVWDEAQVDHTSTGSFGAAIGSLSAGTGSGARTVTVTVNDGTTVLQNARVRLTNGAETYTGLTNVSGVVVFNVDDADWVVSITKAGYSYSGTTLTVNGTETVTYSMSLISLTASDVDKVTGYWTVLDAQGNEVSGVVVTVKARQASRGSAGALHDAATRTATSAVNGLVQFTNMIPGWRYSVVANDEYVADFTVPADAVTSVELGSIVARLT